MTLAATMSVADGTMRSSAIDFDKVYQEHFRFVWHNLHRLGVSDASLDDAAQDVFLVLHRRSPEFDQNAPVRVWLFRTLLKVARDYRRRNQRKGGLAPLDLVDEVVADATPGPHDAAVRSESLRLLDRLLEVLDDDKRAVFVLAEMEQMPVPAIANTLGIKLNTAYSRLRLAREEFNTAVERYKRRVP